MLEQLLPTGTGIARIGGIVGVVWENGWDKQNIYCTTETQYAYYWYDNGYNYATEGRVDKEELRGYASTLGEEFIDDEQNSDGTWKYNNGYSALKWQKYIKQ